ncbi:hypothetical protein F3J20_22630 [Paraburkholderia sp. Cy-641]|nr:hypothetical protein [Paraburkholderia sp. Cy-641]
MTRRYSNTEWLDVLYTSVRNTPGGVAGAATFLTNRRGRSIASEALRQRLNGQGESRPAMDVFELLLEWMQEQRQPHALDALHALNERFGLFATAVESESEIGSVHAVAMRALEHAQYAGAVADKVREALDDDKITVAEADVIADAARSAQRQLDQLVRAAHRAARQPDQ